MIYPIKKPLSIALLSLALSVSPFALAKGSEKLGPKQAQPMISESYVMKTDTDCVAATGAGEKLKGNKTSHSSKSTFFETHCPTEKPVMVSAKTNYTIDAGMAKTLTGIQQDAKVMCCPLGRKWVKSEDHESKA